MKQRLGMLTLGVRDLARARRFYEERGCRAVRFTDGRDNEEKVPDVRYRWERAAG